MSTKTFILNFGHALRSDVVEKLAAEEICIPFDLDMAHPTPVQVADAVKAAEVALRARDAKLDGGASVLIVLPRLREGAVLLLAELHGRMGAFPRIVILRKDADGTYGLPVIPDEELAKLNARMDMLMKIEQPQWEQRRERAFLAAQIRAAEGVLDLEKVRQAARGRRW